MKKEDNKKNQEEDKPIEAKKEGENKKVEEPYSYSEGEFNPDEWNGKEINTEEKNGKVQNGLKIFASIIALVLFGALFIVEFRSLVKVKNSDIVVYNNNDNTDDKKAEIADTTIMTILETGTNYTIYLDRETGVEYIMFKVGSSINIQPLINSDGSYKKYVEPTLPQTGSMESTTQAKISWFNKPKQTESETATTKPAATESLSTENLETTTNTLETKAVK